MTFLKRVPLRGIPPVSLFAPSVSNFECSIGGLNALATLLDRRNALLLPALQTACPFSPFARRTILRGPCWREEALQKTPAHFTFFYLWSLEPSMLLFPKKAPFCHCQVFYFSRIPFFSPCLREPEMLFADISVLFSRRVPEAPVATSTTQVSPFSLTMVR